MRVLLVTKIFPNAAFPDEAPYNRRQFAALTRLCDVQVMATIPWFPGAKRLSKWSIGEDAPREEVIDGLPVLHPRFLYVPRVAPTMNGPLYAASLLPQILRRKPLPDVLVGAFAYPDGYAAVCLGALLGIPAVVKVHGSDVDVLPHQPGMRGPVSWGLQRAARVVAVSRKLADGVEALGVPRAKIDVVMNGVDARLFRPQSRADALASLGRASAPFKERKTLLFIGLLSRDKGVLDLLSVFERLAPAHPDLDLVIVGRGVEEPACRAAADRLGSRLTLTGYLPHDQVSRWIAACDALVLPSHHEGTPNVLIEALTSGRRVVATRVGGIPDVVSAPELGELVAPGDTAALSAAILRVASEPYDPDRVAALGGRSSWDDSARHLHDVLSAVVQGASRRRPHGARRSSDGMSAVP